MVERTCSSTRLILQPSVFFSSLSFICLPSSVLRMLELRICSWKGSVSGGTMPGPAKIEDAWELCSCRRGAVGSQSLFFFSLFTFPSPRTFFRQVQVRIRSRIVRFLDRIVPSIPPNKEERPSLRSSKRPKKRRKTFVCQYRLEL